MSAVMSVAELLAQFLEPALGDLAESNSTDLSAACDIAGLIFRRNFFAWATLIPLVLALTYLSIRFERGASLHFWVLRNYRDLDPATLRELQLTKAHILSQFLNGAWSAALAALVSGFIFSRHWGFLLVA
jgi:hypothetical protein